MIEIQNDGPRIVSTNYWSTPHAAQGFFYLSWNAGAARLLVPRPQVAAIAEMQTADYVILTRGPWPEAGDRMRWELLFEDHGPSPYAVHLVPEMSDRVIPPSDIGRRVAFSAWTEAGHALQLSGRVRSAKRLPCLKRWESAGRA